jgi:hypothetical protein
MARPAADYGAERLREETRQLRARLDDLEAALYGRPSLARSPAGGRGYPAGGTAGVPAYRGERPTRVASNSVVESAPSGPTRLAEAAAVLLRGISVGVIRQVELGFDVFGSFTDAILGRRPSDRFTSQRRRRPETSELLGRDRWLE